jgi:hypothetical protein
MHTTHLLTLLFTSLLALTTASPTTMPTSKQLEPRAEKAVEVCGDFLLASTPMCCNEVADSESEDGLDCKEGKPL